MTLSRDPRRWAFVALCLALCAVVLMIGRWGAPGAYAAAPVSMAAPAAPPKAPAALAQKSAPTAADCRTDASSGKTICNETPATPDQVNNGYEFIASANTVQGEGVTVELNPVGTSNYLRYACDTQIDQSGLPNGTAARFRCISDQTYSAGTQVRYQFMICDWQSTGSNCKGYTDFNWTFTAPNPPASNCSGATQDNNVYYVGLGHNSFDTGYRNPTGPVPAGSGPIVLKFRTCKGDVTGVDLRVWDDRLDQQTVSPMTYVGDDTDPTVGAVSFWAITVTVPTSPTALYYTFRPTDGSTTAYYSAQHADAFYGGRTVPGGWGHATSSQGDAEGNSFQITVYDPNYSVPSWMQRGIVYQIFPDRFRDGNTANDPPPGRFFYDQQGGTIYRSNGTNWNTTICDPRNNSGPCPGAYSNNFYGGDLAGITQKINQGYFDAIGATVLYLNPIFRSPSNHKYDTADYRVIDPDFGTLSDFQAMVAAANAHGMRIILDGVFNHTSSDSKYFDRYSRYDAAGNLTSPNGVGTNDGSGACESTNSGYRSWYYFSDLFPNGSPWAEDSPGVYALCAPVDQQNQQTKYEAWYGYSSLPKLQANSQQVRDLIWAQGTNSVGPYWVSQGASGWRFDVGGDVDPGLTNDPNNTYWEGFRQAVRDQNVTGKSDVLMLGEEWGDATPWLLGNEWDSVMNYRFRAAVLGWLFTGCTANSNGCNATGTEFQDNDANSGSVTGPIGQLSPSQFDIRLRTIQQDYPPMAFKAMMNLEGSHDTNRLAFLLKQINGGDAAAAGQRLREWWLFAYTYAGAPTLYYGDEMGVGTNSGVWDNSTWQDDPYNRIPFPWNDTQGDYTANTGLQDDVMRMASIRESYRALQDGDVQHGLIVDDANKLYGFARTSLTETALILLNQDNADHQATFSGLNAPPYNLPDGTVLEDALDTDNLPTYTVSGGQITATVKAHWAVVLLEKNKIDTPVPPPNTSAVQSGSNVLVSWSQVITDTNGEREQALTYWVYRGLTPDFTPSDNNNIGGFLPPHYGTPDGKMSVDDPNTGGYAYYYKVRVCNAAGNCNTSAPFRGPGNTFDTPTPTSTDTATSTATTTLSSTATNTAVSSSTATTAPSNTTVPSSTSTTAPTNTTAPSSTSTTAAATSTATRTATSASTSAPTNTATRTSTATRTVKPTATACTIQFQDVPPGDPGQGSFYPYVRCLACRGILSGYKCGGPGEPCFPAGTTPETGNPYFRPGNNITRGQIAKVVANAAGYNDTVQGQTYSDVVPGDPFYLYIERLTLHNVMSGYPCGTTDPNSGVCDGTARAYFRPGNNATRGQLAKIVSNAAGFTEDIPGQQYADVPPGSTFYPFIQRLGAAGVISGYACGGPGEPCNGEHLPYFRPGNSVTRAQAAKIVANTFFPNCQTR